MGLMVQNETNMKKIVIRLLLAVVFLVALACMALAGHPAAEAAPALRIPAALILHSAPRLSACGADLWCINSMDCNDLATGCLWCSHGQCISLSTP